MAKDSAVRIEIGRSFHQLGTVQEKVRESDLVPLWDGTTRRRSLAEHGGNRRTFKEFNNKNKQTQK